MTRSTTAFLYKILINAWLIGKRRVIAALRDAPASDDKDLIGITNRMQPMRDHKQCFAAHELRNGFLNVTLVVDIDAGCGFVKDNDRRIF